MQKLIKFVKQLLQAVVKSRCRAWLKLGYLFSFLFCELQGRYVNTHQSGIRKKTWMWQAEIDTHQKKKKNKEGDKSCT